MAETIALLAAGLIAPFLTDLIKRLIGVKKVLALCLAVLVSVVLALLSLLIAGVLEGTGIAALGSGAVFSLATIIYKLFLAKK